MGNTLISVLPFSSRTVLPPRYVTSLDCRMISQSISCGVRCQAAWSLTSALSYVYSGLRRIGLREAAGGDSGQLQLADPAREEPAGDAAARCESRLGGESQGPRCRGVLPKSLSCKAIEDRTVAQTSGCKRKAECSRYRLYCSCTLIGKSPQDARWLNFQVPRSKL